MKKIEKKLVKKLQDMIDGIKDGSIIIISVSATTGDALTIGTKIATYSNIITFEFSKKTTF